MNSTGRRGRTHRIRVGAVSYLNSKPLIYRLAEIAPQAELVLDFPSRLADGLMAGDLDVALIPSVELHSDSAYTIVSDACIACRGPVLSVKLFSRVPPGRIESLALDEGSRTSAVLAQILLHERFGIRPRVSPLPIGSTVEDTDADAVLLIGDRAIHSPPGKFAEVWDLGDEWCRHAERPFVFAMWVARTGTDLNGVERALAESRDLGLKYLNDIAALEAAPLGLTRPQCLSYLRDNLYFHLGPREREGLEMFLERASTLGLVPETGDFRLRFRGVIAATVDHP